MTDPFDAVARRAAGELRARVDATVDTEAALLEVSGAPPRRRAPGRLLAVAASCALIAGTLVMVGNLGDGGSGERVTVDTDRDLVAMPLTLAGPRDGRDSIGLPVTVEPDTGLVDGQTVSVTGTGFEPGEQVGIVMCSRAAGRVDLGGAGAGAEACDITRFEQVTAGADGVASGTFVVEQALTTPYTGTIDCAASAEACLVAMGALADYDRSGGSAIAFADGLDPLDLPTLEVSPTEGLADGDVVRLTGTDWDPGAELFVELCSADPSACWSLGDDGPVRAGQDGTLDAEVAVWRFLPGEPGTYVDCAISNCLIRTSSYVEVAGSRMIEGCGPGCVDVYSERGASAPPVQVFFAPGGEPPTAAALEVTPATGLATGDVVQVLGSGFGPGTELYVHLCATHVGSGEQAEDGMFYPDMCMGLDMPSDSGWDWLPWVSSSSGGSLRTDDEGRFGFEAALPDLGGWDDDSYFVTETTMVEACAGDDCPAPDPMLPTPVQPMPPRTIDCADPAWSCDVRVDGYWYGGSNRPVFMPPPVPLTYR